MGEDQVTITLPISGHAFGVIITVLGVALLSIFVFWATGKAKRKDWLSTLRQRLGLTGLHQVLVVFFIILWAALFVALLTGVFWVLFAIGERMSVSSEEEGQDLRWYLLTLTAVTAALGAVIALPFTLIKTALNNRQTETAEQGLITDRINKAVEGLGHAKKSVRIGALHSLYTLGRDERVFPGQVSGIMASHIRMLAKKRKTEPFPDPIPEVYEGSHSRAFSCKNHFAFLQRNDKSLSKWLEELPKPSEELQTAITLWGRLPRKEKFKTDFSDCNFTKVKFVDCDLSQINFTSTKLDGAKFHHCRFLGSSFNGTKETEKSSDDGCSFHVANGATLYQTYFRKCEFKFARAVGAVFDGAIFVDCRIKFSDFSGASFAMSEFRDCEITGTLWYLAFIKYLSKGINDILEGNLIYLADWPETWDSENVKSIRTPTDHDNAEDEWHQLYGER
ncbi:hypothetical protein HAT86_02800 [Roseovarius gahaiensis]|uniref:Pentapeptide repeat-containing protein n=1 Tax=Roseovarius gahaiensis TaxID=2716691 RepID=A0A967B8S2_9RHOB|nr:pentapeptide repeat-containing protein [Roseovarius gahaiensis]NHQ73395.1 hypothetical protein [Roseovarius gahaiensis]